jgi:hypothetical protein
LSEELLVVEMDLPEANNNRIVQRTWGLRNDRLEDRRPEM